jgi:hypothetical protein
LHLPRCGSPKEKFQNISLLNAVGLAADYSLSSSSKRKIIFHGISSITANNARITVSNLWIKNNNWIKVQNDVYTRDLTCFESQWLTQMDPKRSKKCPDPQTADLNDKTDHS